MKLYFRECKRIAASLIYYLFLFLLIFNWFRNFRGVTKTEIDLANGGAVSRIGSFNRPLLMEPTREDDYFGSKISEDNPEAIMMGVTRALLIEYRNNSYAAYPFGYYKAISLSPTKQSRVLQIIKEITGLTEEQLNDLPQNYFPASTGSIIYTGTITEEFNSSENDKSKRFLSQVSYDTFCSLMCEMEELIGEKGTKYSKDMMLTYFGLSEMTYEEACADYRQTIEKDKVSGGFARLFCDYMGLSLGFYPIFLVIFLWLKDRSENTSEVLYTRTISSRKLVVSRYLACITMIFVPIFLLSLESLLPLLSFGAKNGLTVDCFSFLKYTLWWLLPTVMMVTAVGIFFTLLTDSPFAVIFQFLWWFLNKGGTALSGGTKTLTLMLRHNSLNGYEIIRDEFTKICLNRLLIAGLSVVLVFLSSWILTQKRKGRINASIIYHKCFSLIQNKFSPSHPE